MTIKSSFQKNKGSWLCYLLLIFSVNIDTISAMNTDDFAPVPSKYLIVWAGNQELTYEKHSSDFDFLAVIDTDMKSKTFGEVINTAAMASITKEKNAFQTEGFIDTTLKNAVIDKENQAEGVSSTFVSDDSHLNINYVFDPITGYHYFNSEGLSRTHVYACDISDPFNITPLPGTQIRNGVFYDPSIHKDVRNLCGLVNSEMDVADLSGTNDILILPNGDLVATYWKIKSSESTSEAL